MAVEPKTWVSGEMLTAAAMNAQLRDMIASLYTGQMGIAAQGPLDFIYAASASQLGRLGGGAALQYPRRNAANNGWEFASSSSLLDMQGGRLTLESGVPVSTSNQSAKTTLCFMPYVHNLISLYDGARWNTRTFSELSLSLVGYTAGKGYDIWAYDNSGTVALESTVWTSATVRATPLARQDGRWCKSGALTRRYIGSILVNAAGGQTDDNLVYRYVWNMDNRVPRQLLNRGDNTYRQTSHLGAWWYAYGIGTPQGYPVNMMVGLAEDAVHANAGISWYYTVADAVTASICIAWNAAVLETNSVTAMSYTALAWTGATSSYFPLHTAFSSVPPGIGWRQLYLNTFHTHDCTWYGIPNSYHNPGIVATFRC